MRRLLPLAVLVAFPALAQDRPPAFQPTRDVAVTYRMEPGAPGQQGGQQTMSMAWLAAQNAMRVDPPGNQGWLVVDRNANRAFMVMDAQRIVMELPAEAAGGMMMNTTPPASARFTRGGSETVAGTRCTVWNFVDGGSTGTACITEDGVMLRAQGQSPGQPGGRMEATEVRYGPQDAARFRAPAGYQTMTMPGGVPGAGGPPGIGGPPGQRSPAR